MSTRTLIELNHDRADLMRLPSLIDALMSYMRHPEGQSGRYNAELLSDYGLIVYGTAHSDDTQTRGFRAPDKELWFKVIGSSKPLNEPPF